MKPTATLLLVLLLQMDSISQPSRADSTMFVHVILQPQPYSIDAVFVVPYCYVMKKNHFTGEPVETANIMSGVVRDSLRQPIPYATIELENYRAGMRADSAGRFLFSVKKADSLQLKITAVGFKTKLLRVAESSQPLEITLEAHVPILDPVVVQASPSHRTGGCGIRCICIVSTQRPVKSDTTSKTTVASPTIYPNPAKPGMVVSIKTPAETQTLHVVNNSGQVVLQLDRVELKGKMLQLQIPPSMTAGVYYLVLAGRNNQRSAQKIIIQ